MSVHVTSEVGRLRRVLIHEPGLEVDRMVPAMMEELLFDDILFGENARLEHARFRRVMQTLGVQTLEASELLDETLQIPAARDWVVSALAGSVPRTIENRVESAAPAELARILVEGIRLDPNGPGIEADELFDMPPIPNWCFQRDPQIVVQGSVMISAMATPARWREALLSSTIFRFHPSLATTPLVVDPLDIDTGRRIPLGPLRPRFEGGDVLVLSPDVVAVGYSERTNRTGIRWIAEALAGLDGGPRWLIVVKIPSRRAYMHLDTVMTPIDRDACLVYPPVITEKGSDATRVFEIDLHSEERAVSKCDNVLSALRRRGVDLEPIPCGGADPIHQQREQWTDGANAMAIAPGVITLFDRNVSTAECLSTHGFDVVTTDDILLGKAEVDVEAGKRTCILLPSHELSRARGGPHCLTHPLERDPI